MSLPPKGQKQQQKQQQQTQHWYNDFENKTTYKYKLTVLQLHESFM